MTARMVIVMNWQEDMFDMHDLDWWGNFMEHIGTNADFKCMKTHDPGWPRVRNEWPVQKKYMYKMLIRSI